MVSVMTGMDATSHVNNALATFVTVTPTTQRDGHESTRPTKHDAITKSKTKHQRVPASDQ
jgi:hypothetical protein